MTTPLAAALAVEGRKLAGSRVIRTTTIATVVGITVLSASLTSAAGGGNEQVIAQLGPYARDGGWDLLTSVAAQITAAGGLLGFGIALSWIIGREFADATITGLFALPVSRPTIVAAKLLAYLCWAIGVAFALTALVALAGLLLGLDRWDQDVTTALGRQFTLTVVSALIGFPAGWAATLGRGLLPGVATTIGLIVTAQVTAVAGAGGWFPLTTAALWALDPATIHPAQLTLTLVIPAAFTALTVSAWARLQLDR